MPQIINAAKQPPPRDSAMASENKSQPATATYNHTWPETEHHTTLPAGIQTKTTNDDDECIFSFDEELAQQQHNETSTASDIAADIAAESSHICSLEQHGLSSVTIRAAFHHTIYVYTHNNYRLGGSAGVEDRDTVFEVVTSRECMLGSRHFFNPKHVFYNKTRATVAWYDDPALSLYDCKALF